MEWHGDGPRRVFTRYGVVQRIYYFWIFLGLSDYQKYPLSIQNPIILLKFFNLLVQTVVWSQFMAKYRLESLKIYVEKRISAHSSDSCWRGITAQNSAVSTMWTSDLRRKFNLKQALHIDVQNEQYVLHQLPSSLPSGQSNSRSHVHASSIHIWLPWHSNRPRPQKLSPANSKVWRKTIKLFSKTLFHITAADRSKKLGQRVASKKTFDTNPENSLFYIIILILG